MMIGFGWVIRERIDNEHNFGGFKSGKGYWFKVRSEALCPGIEAGEPCDELLDFEYNTPSGDVDSRLANSSLPIAPEGFEYTQSTALNFSISRPNLCAISTGRSSFAFNFLYSSKIA